MELEPIKHVWINHDNDLVDLAIAYTTKDKQGHPVQQVDTVHTNKKHPFLTQEKGFVEVAHLDVGLHLIRADGSVGTLVAWNVVAGTSTMYNLEVTQDHTFTVSDGQWVVHNCGFDRSIKNVEELDNSLPGQLEHNPQTVNVGRSGGNRSLTGMPNSYQHTTGGHALVYDREGSLAYDVSQERIKMVKFNTNPKTGQTFIQDFKLRNMGGKLVVPPEWQTLLP